MSDYSTIPNTITSHGEVAITGQRLKRIEDALFGMRSNTLIIRKSDIISIDLPSGIGGVDLSSRPFYVSVDQSIINIGANRANIPAIFTIGTITTIDAIYDNLQWATLCPTVGRYLVVYQLAYFDATATTVAYIRAVPQVVAEADILTMQNQSYVIWPIAWLNVAVDGQRPTVLAQIEQGYIIHIPAMVM